MGNQQIINKIEDDVNDGNFEIIPDEERTKQFKEIFFDINFIGMKVEDVIDLLGKRGFQKYCLLSNDEKFLTDILNGADVIIHTDKDQKIVVKEPICFLSIHLKI